MNNKEYDTRGYGRDQDEQQFYLNILRLNKTLSIKYLSFNDRYDIINWGTDEKDKIRFETSHETDDIFFHRFNELLKIEDVLSQNNNMINKKLILSDMLKKRIKQNYLKKIEPMQLPHDIENIILSFCI